MADGSDRGTYLGVAEDAAVVLGHLDALDTDPYPHRWVRIGLDGLVLTARLPRPT